MDIIYNKIFSVISGKNNSKINREDEAQSETINNFKNNKSINLLDTLKNTNQLIISESELFSEQMPSSISSISSVGSAGCTSSTGSTGSTDSIDSIDSINSINSMDSICSDKLTDDETNRAKYTKKTEKQVTKDTIDTISIAKKNFLFDKSKKNSNKITPSLKSDKSINLKKKEKSESSNDSYSDETSSSSLGDKKLTIESAVEKKYLTSALLNKKKYYEEIKELNTNNLRTIEINIVKNSYSNVLNLLMDGDILYKKDTSDNIIKICSNKNCNGKCEKAICNKNGLYYSLWNNIRGVKTIYNLLIKLLILYPQFRNKCKCCEDEQTKIYLDKLEEEYNQNKFKYEENNNVKMELKINYLINKFTSVIGIMTCQCKFINKYYEFYQENYLNFRKMYKNYKKTIPFIILMLKVYFNIKENHEELTLIKDSRCIHEDIRYNNFTHCLKKTSSTTDKKKIIENICNLELVSVWTMESFEISLLLFNEQSLETFRHILYKYKKEIDIINLFKRIYNKKNNILNLNYVSNKKNLLNSLLYVMKNKKNFEFEYGKELVNTIILQLYYRNKKYKDIQTKINEMMLQYLIECFNYDQMRLGLEFFKNIKNLQSNNFISKIEKSINFNKYSIISIFPNGMSKSSNYSNLLKFMFDTILESDANNQIKISYLKIINKHKINVIQYDFINKLIDISEGDKIISELIKYKKSDNISFEQNDYFLNLNNYSNVTYINSIIKKCISKQRVNILDYLLNGLNSKIKERFVNLINPFLIYFSNVIDCKKEYEYIEILKIITKYKYNINVLINIDIKEVKEFDKNSYNLLYSCIKNKLNDSAKILINNSIDTLIISESKNLLYHCIDHNNHIILGVILNKDSKLINDISGNLKIHTYLFTRKELDENILMRFLMKIIKIKEFDVNYHDKYNPHIGFQILNSNISKRNKILLFKLLIEEIDPMVIKNNIPLILYSVIVDEYEITYTLLNKLIINKNIKKNSSNVNSLLDYEYTNDKININFIPVIFKYIKEHSIKNQIEMDKLYLEVDIFIENILIMIAELSIYILMYKFDYEFEFVSKNNKNGKYINNQYKEKLDGYLAIDENISNEITSENGYMEISLETNSLKKPNKNIWKGVKNTEKEIKFESNLKFKLKSDNIDNLSQEINNSSILNSEFASKFNSESSEIEESEICFNNLI